MSVIASGDEVLRNLEHYLELKKFRNIQVNYSEGEIFAEKRKFIFGKRNKINLKVMQVNDITTNIELVINPEIKERSAYVNELEEKLRDKIYHYL